jgi:3-dehydroquinate synthase
MKKLKVDLDSRSYPIFVRAKLAALGAYLKKQKYQGPAFVITNTTVANLYLGKLAKGLKKSGFKVFSCVISDGEQYKTLDTLKKIYSKALKSGIDRSSVAIALGGGVVGDIAGFFASSYMRGIPLIQAPTTLLAMVDASIGGKTGVDLEEGKNLVGAFYQPKAVWMDLAVLRTLPAKQLRNGLAEVIKYGIISDARLFAYLEKQIAKGFSPKDWEDIIFRCAGIKVSVVEKDEFETKGLREILNFGHTFGHAIETLGGYRKYLHGEAVSIGMSLAATLAARLKILSVADQKSIEALLRKTGLPVRPKERYSPQKFTAVMLRDKKVKAGKLRLVLPVKIGSVKVFSNLPVNLVRRVIK